MTLTHLKADHLPLIYAASGGCLIRERRLYRDRTGYRGAVRIARTMPDGRQIVAVMP